MTAMMTTMITTGTTIATTAEAPAATTTHDAKVPAATTANACNITRAIRPPTTQDTDIIALWTLPPPWMRPPTGKKYHVLLMPQRIFWVFQIQIG